MKILHRMRLFASTVKVLHQRVAMKMHEQVMGPRGPAAHWEPMGEAYIEHEHFLWAHSMVLVENEK